MSTPGPKLGTAPVFLTAISTILGAIMFLRFGYAVAHVGVLGVFLIILLGHLVTIPTGMAIAEIATNQKVEGGGEYYIISRSFGMTIGGAIGLALFLSQAVSVAFYVIAFAEAFRPVFAWLQADHGIVITDMRVVSMPAALLLCAIVLYKGADLGMKVLYVVVAVLALSLVFFFFGAPISAPPEDMSFLTRTVADPDPFFYVFAICFPAFTGMTAGVGLSGDLKNTRRSIPLGTLSATIFGMVVYLALAYFLGYRATPEELNSNPLVMGEIAIWEPIIPIGLACATFSSAVGSILVAPRTLQAIGADDLFPGKEVGKWLSKGKGASNEPFNATLVVSVIAVLFVGLGDVNSVAEIISMFFMVAYGSICLISFLEHFAADPAYRPTFNSRWYISLFGAVMCFFMMFQMNAFYAFLSLSIMTLVYLVISYTNPDKSGLAAIFQGVIFQFSRQIQIFMQKRRQAQDVLNWRPSVVCVSASTFTRTSALDLLRWMSHRHGFGTYIHFIRGYLSKETKQVADETMARLLRLIKVGRGRVFVDTIVSPSETSAISQVIQLPGVSGHENNGLLMEFSKRDPVDLAGIISHATLVAANQFDFFILASSDRNFGYRSEIHLWITPQDEDNANLMILLAYIFQGDPDWRDGAVKIFAAYPERKMSEEEERLRVLVRAGRLPISPNNITMIPYADTVKALVNQHSRDADLVILGYRNEMVKHFGEGLFQGYDAVGDVLFVRASSQRVVASPEEIRDVPTPPEVKTETEPTENVEAASDGEAGDQAHRPPAKSEQMPEDSGSGI
ncbi:amino acid permease [Acanthopleuribacter pedis]|uniref:Amino acid permease/ SLC12A domain-containing protein n=1 Tax=Acanthopleuribacter pedis TaxID=442870 RepID=A0A8J7Q207_9BACT|nr:amino acid permease [Acanthopleuribacter pedis]MBO1319027.1 hypothetical protein [Acanthopleuribacter pedis]